MKYTPPFRIENDSIFEYSSEHNAYIFICKKICLTKKEYKEILMENKKFETIYDNHNKSL